MSRGTDVSSYFASVIQLIASPNLEIKKLVYIYLLRYAESNPDLALMSINTIQKSLSDKNQIVASHVWNKSAVNIRDRDTRNTKMYYRPQLLCA
jgi:vesicle coat complex subunit